MRAIAYLSTAVHMPTQAELEFLLSDAREFNEQHAVTGALLLHDVTFFQYFEGGASDVDEVYDRIKKSRLHRGIIELLNDDAPQRYFDSWHMGFAQAPPGLQLQLSQAQWRQTSATHENRADLPLGVDMLVRFWKGARRTL